MIVANVNKSGWYILVGFNPFVGEFLLFIALCTYSVDPNKYDYLDFELLSSSFLVCLIK